MARILIIDDSMITRKALKNLLQGEGYETLEAVNGKQGIELVEIHSPDCILLDLLMPDISGQDVLRALRERGQTVPVVVLTADIQDTVREECLSLGARTLLNKPVDTAMLKETLKNVLDVNRGGGA